MRLVSLALLGGAVLSCAAPAGAAPLTGITADLRFRLPFEEPVPFGLAGSEALFARDQAVYAAAPGAQPRRLASFKRVKSKQGEPTSMVSIAGDATPAIAFATQTWDDDTEPDAEVEGTTFIVQAGLYAGPATGPFGLVAGSPRDVRSGKPDDVRMAEGAVVWDDRGRRGVILARESGGAVREAFTAPGRQIVSAFDVAGPYLAVAHREEFKDKTTVRLLDRRTSATLREITFDDESGHVQVFVQADGKLALGLPVNPLQAQSTSSRRYALAWLAPEDSAPRVVVRDVERLHGAGGNQMIYTTDFSGTLHAVDLAGSARAITGPLANFGTAQVQGSMLAYVAFRNCLVAGEIPATAGPPVFGRCPSSGMELLPYDPRGRKLLVQARCDYGPVAGCRGRMTVRPLRDRHAEPLAEATYALAEKAKRNLSVMVDARRLLAERRRKSTRRTRFIISFATEQPEGGFLENAQSVGVSFAPLKRERR
jgi:hypothetical protein